MVDELIFVCFEVAPRSNTLIPGTLSIKHFVTLKPSAIAALLHLFG